MQPHPPASSFSLSSLHTFALDILRAQGMDESIATSVADGLVTTDAMGRRTHGLAMLPLYVDEIAKGHLKLCGTPTVVKDWPSALLWDGGYLPGIWLTRSAIALACDRAKTQGVVTVSIRRSHHIGCLAMLVKDATDRGMIAIIANSDPAGKRVAPYGGCEPLFTPNPFAIGYPGEKTPVLVDICASITTVSMTRQHVAAGTQFAHPWLLDSQGQPTTDPRLLEGTQPPGSLQLLGGQEYGHKGFGLALMVEALSQGLSGQGRLDAPLQWGGNTFVQVIEPEFFAGREAFLAQTGYFAEKARSNRPIDPDAPVRLPGDQAMANLNRAQVQGLAYDAIAWEALSNVAATSGVALPNPLNG